MNKIASNIIPVDYNQDELVPKKHRQRRRSLAAAIDSTPAVDSRATGARGRGRGHRRPSGTTRSRARRRRPPTIGSPRRSFCSGASGWRAARSWFALDGLSCIGPFRPSPPTCAAPTNYHNSVYRRFYSFQFKFHFLFFFSYNFF